MGDYASRASVAFVGRPALRGLAAYAAEYDAPLIGRGVRNTVNARKAQYNGVALGEFAPQSTAALDYEEAVSAYLAAIGANDAGRDS